MNIQRLLTGAALSLPLPALAQGAVAPEYKWLTFLVFGCIIALTMFVTYLAARRVKSASQFYAAGRSVSGRVRGRTSRGMPPI